MKRIILTILTSMLIMSSCVKDENPLLAEKWNTPYETPPFSKIKTQHFEEAIPILINEARAEMDSIINSDQAPTFSNTYEAMELSGKKLSRALGVFYNLKETNASDELQQIAEKMSPMLSAYNNDISLNEKLFARIKSVHDYYCEDSTRLSELTQEQRMLLKITYDDFVRSGALLSDSQKQQLREITEKLSLLTLKFSENSRKSTNAFSILISDSTEISGIPSWGVDMAREEAKADSKEGWKFTLQAPSYISVIEYADNRDLRENMCRHYNTLALGGEFDNSEIIKEITDLRLQLAKLFGYSTYADYVISDRMAGSREKVETFLNNLLDASYHQARQEVRAIEEYANSKGFWDYMQPWDFSYWAEKYRQANFNLDDDMTRPYFRLENVEKALFLLAGKLYGLQFIENKDIETYDKDARAYEVRNADGQFQAILYLDYFPRPSKRSGAWMNTFRDVYVDKDGNEVRPIVTLVCNFTKPTENEPSLLSFDEFQTILHEFGHGLHGMLAKGSYSSLTGTNVNRDFVELPSQIMENWAYQKEYLDLWAVHYKTGEVIPSELVEKIIAAKNYNSAYANVRQLMFCFLDMAWHTLDEAPVKCSIVDFENEATKRTYLLPVIPGTSRSATFTHIFSGGYAAGYYSYKWSEMLEADAFNVFKQNGIFDSETALRFRNLLEAGRSIDAMELFVNFTGHEPTIAPLLDKLGIKDNNLQNK